MRCEAGLGAGGWSEPTVLMELGKWGQKVRDDDPSGI